MKWGPVAAVFGLAAIVVTSCEHARIQQTVLLQLHTGGTPAPGVEVELSLASSSSDQSCASTPLDFIKPTFPSVTGADGTYRWRHRMTAYRRSHSPDSMMLCVRMGEEMRRIWSTHHTMMNRHLNLNCDLTPVPTDDLREIERRQLGLALANPAIAGCSAVYAREFDEIVRLAATLLLGFTVIRVLLRNRPDQSDLEFQVWGPGILYLVAAAVSHRLWFGTWFAGAGFLTAILWLLLINWQLWRRKAPACGPESERA